MKLGNLKSLALPAVAAAGTGFLTPTASGMLPKSWNRPVPLAVLGILCIYIGKKKPLFAPIGYALLAMAAASQARGGNMAGPQQIKVLSPRVLGNMGVGVNTLGRAAGVMGRGATVTTISTR